MRLRYNDKESVSVRLRYGAEGYCVLSCLFDRLEMSSDSLCEADFNNLALEFGSSPQLVKSIVEDFGIFDISDGFFCYRKMKDERDKISEAKRKAVNRRWELERERKASTHECSDDTHVSDNNTDVSLSNTHEQNNDTGVYENDTYVSKNDTHVLTSSSPPIPPSKYIISQKISKDISELNNAHTCERVSSKQKKYKLNYRARLVFESVYEDMYDAKCYWDAKESANMDRLMKKIRFSRESRASPLPTDDDSLLDALRQFLCSIDDNWVFDNFSVSVINSKYNEIISGIKNKRKTNNEKDKSRLSDRQGTPAAAVRDPEKFKKGF